MIDEIPVLLALCCDPKHIYEDPRLATQMAIALSDENTHFTRVNRPPEKIDEPVSDEEATIHFIAHQPPEENGASWFRKWWEEKVAPILEKQKFHAPCISH